MSCTFWNMRRKLRAQQKQKEKVITDLAAAQTAETEEKAVTANDNKRTGRKAKAGDSTD